MNDLPNNILLEEEGQNRTYEIGAESILGTRKYQQDFAYMNISEEALLLCVCDGMGGMNGGELASSTAAGILSRAYNSAFTPGDVPRFLAETAKKMDREVASLKRADQSPLGGGTTFVGAYLKGNLFYWVSAGDSKIWILRGETLRNVNREHNYEALLREQLADGRITKEFFDTEMQTKRVDALTSYVGMGGLTYLDVSTEPIGLLPGDIVVLCSDGITKSLSDAQSTAMIRDNDIDMEIAASRLCAMALRCGKKGQDNTTVILARYTGKDWKQ